MLKASFLASVVSFLCFCPWNEQWKSTKSSWLTFSVRVTDNKGKTHDVLTGSDDGRRSNTSLAWGAGVQFNPTESVAIDIAYEGSGSGDWRTDGFIVGVGYKF
ncbi:TPA: Ail/Lom family outer membrane beta-barrel protein [Escherichia coli]|nr:Ail/Lom family outer membrane beta-barrel protein [Escherichia coli]HAI4467455.1 Ail/Lom family outer membrane beta-barrel protein [Escherichia coli]HBA3158142.1 Ail/Lom family outer membrane beta-barrel protein [Escherichia coli]